MKKSGSLDQVGLRLSRQALRVLKERGIFVQSAVRLEHQHLAKRYVVRGLESGGAVGDLGRYVTFAQPDGRPIECLHPVEAIGVNRLHAVVVAPVLVRIEMVRKGRTYELLITQHRSGEPLDGKRPALETKVLFRGNSRSLGVGFGRKGQEPSGHCHSDVLFTGRRGSPNPETVSGSGPSNRQGRELCGMLPQPLCQSPP